ncbi:MAG: diphosphomevalonate decarboxylase [Myxococcales bacterium]|nr:MAG: diphosphomevalonate decarboxylase [Myxococcales bacterium]
MSSITAIARPNIALIKYWGKQDRAANLPVTGSLSMTLDHFHTRTTITPDSSLKRDEILLNSRSAASGEAERIVRLLDRIRADFGVSGFVRVESENNFPTASGLASSASGFAALALAAARAFGLTLELRELSELARRGSGSAPRSLLGGLVMYAPESPGSDAYRLSQLRRPDEWELRMIVAVTTDEPKKVGSTEGMERTRRSSPYFRDWALHNTELLRKARDAVAAGNFAELGSLTESSCFSMHAVMMSANPPLVYWNPATLAVMRKVWDLREQGLEGYVTIDAGPHVKVLCEPQSAEALTDELRRIENVRAVFIERPGPGAEIVS